jgi:hypothetical protein
VWKKSAQTNNKTTVTNLTVYNQLLEDNCNTVLISYVLQQRAMFNNICVLPSTITYLQRIILESIFSLLLSSLILTICYYWRSRWREHEYAPVIVLGFKKGDKTDCNNYIGVSFWSATYKIVVDILLQKLTPYAEEIVVDHQCEFQCKRSSTDHIFCICLILAKKGNTSSNA